MLLVGVGLAIGIDLYLKFLRATLFGEMAGRIDYLIGTSTFAKLMRLPLSYTDGSSVTAQVARLREFQAVRALARPASLGAARKLSMAASSAWADVSESS